MSAGLASQFALRPLPQNVDLQILEETQAYLRGRYRHQTPRPGEEEAWGRFYATYAPLLSHWLLHYHLSYHDLSDCLQDALAEVVRKLPSFVSDGTQRGLCSWLRVIARAKAADFFRHEKRHGCTPLGREAETTLVSQTTTPQTDQEQQQRQSVLECLLAALGQEIGLLNSRAFSLHWLEKKTIKEVAAELNITERAARRRVHKAKQKFVVLCENDLEKDLLTAI
jgi:RNA polymerase sigma factor (sigma-70 family)